MAFLATRPAAISTLGLEVLVQEVMAAMTTSPWPTSNFSPATGTRWAMESALPKSLASASLNSVAAVVSRTRSWGRLGPARDGTTLERSSSRVSVKTGSGSSPSRHMPWTLA